MPIAVDFGRWVYWWEFNKEQYLDIRDAVRDAGVVTDSDDFFMGAGRIDDVTRGPTAYEVDSRIVPALVAALESSRDREIVAESLIALAKIGQNPHDRDLVDLVTPHLHRQDGRVREAAILALGISQREEAVEPLIDLLGDTDAGRRLVQRGRVSLRSRAFAAYGLGCIGASTRVDDVRERVASELRALLEQDLPGVDVHTAAIHALGVLDLRSERRLDRRILDHSVGALMKFFAADRGRGAERIQAHAATAAAKLLARCPKPALASWCKSTLRRELTAEGDDRRSDHIARSAILALGVLASPVDSSDDVDAELADLLWDSYQDAKDEQSRSFALIALGQMGGTVNRDRLLRALRGRSLHRPWAALALGVAGRGERERNDTDGADPIVVDALRRVLRERKNPDLLASSALALGLCRATSAVGDIDALLRKYRQRSFLGGYLCTSLALLGDDVAADSILATVENAENRPQLLRRGAIALALLRQTRTAKSLLGLLERDDASSVRARAVAPALSRVGDHSVVKPLIDFLGEEALTDTSRSMVALALGGIADKEDVPWYTRFAENANYRAGVGSFAGEGNGILDRY